MPTDEFICDSSLKEGWYRITSGAGELMPTECAEFGWRCGTANPIYLKDGKKILFTKLLNVLMYE